MINEEKVKSMTKAAVYENGEKKKSLEICDYFRSDYISLQLIKSAVAYIVAFCCGLVLWFMSSSEELLLKFSQPEYMQGVLKMIAILFVTGLCVYVAVLYFYYAWKYARATERTAEFQNHLKDINKFYETEEAEDDYTVIDLSDEESML